MAIFFEYHACAYKKSLAQERSERMATGMMSLLLGINFYEDISWNL